MSGPAFWILILISCLSFVSAQKRCYKCSGGFHSRECELYPKYTVTDLEELRCSLNYCGTQVMYKPKTYLKTINAQGQLKGFRRPLTPRDFDVHSVNRTCQDEAMKDSCVVNHSDQSMTCYSTCANDLCNDGLRRPAWEDVRKMSPPDFESPDPEEEEKNSIKDLDFDDEFEFQNRPGNPYNQDGYDDEEVVDFTDSGVTDSDSMVTKRINDNFDVSSHGNSDDNYSPDSMTSKTSNVTSQKPPLPKPTNKVKGGRNNDNGPQIKGRDGKVSRAKGNLKVKSDDKTNSAASVSFSLSLVLLESAFCWIGLTL